MKINWTNIHELHEPVAEAITYWAEKYSKGDADFSVTELIGPPRIRALRKSVEELERDVVDAYHAFMGSAKHATLEPLGVINPDRYTCEERYFADFEGVKISGQIDLHDKQNYSLSDYKETKWPSYADGVKLEWVQQLNVCRWLAIQSGVDIKSLYSVGLFRDYSKLTCDVKPPRWPWQAFEVPVWPLDEVEEFIRLRIQLHRDAENTLPACTDDEVWRKSDSWAVEPVNKGPNQRALKLFYSGPEEAESYRANHKRAKGLVVVHRPGLSPRCQSFCDVSHLCDQWRVNPTNPRNQNQRPS